MRVTLGVAFVTLLLANVAFLLIGNAQPAQAAGFGGDCDPEVYDYCACLSVEEFEVYNCDGFFDPVEVDCFQDIHCEP